MEFNCPACSAPHAFPDDQVPTDGIVVACTRCGAHITLNRSGVQGARPLEPEPVEPEPTVGMPPPEIPPADSTRESRPPVPSNRPAAPAPPMPVDMADDDVADPDDEPSLARTAAEGDSGLFSAARKAMSAAKRGAVGAFDSAASEAIEAETDVPEGLAFPGFGPSDGAWTWRDLPRAFLGVLDARRVIFATAGFWAALVVFGLLNWVAGFLGGLWGPLGTIFSIVAWLGFVGAAAIVASILGYVVHQTIVERRASSVKAGVEWTKSSIKSVVGTPLAFVVVIGAIWLVQFGVGMLGRIPFAGPIVWGAVSPVTVLLSLAAGAVGVVLLDSIPLYIPVIYNEKTGPKETLLRLGGLFRANGFRLALYLLVTIVTMGFAFIVVVMPMLTLATKVGLGGAIAGLRGREPGQDPRWHAGRHGLRRPRLPGRPGRVDVPFQYDLAGWLAGIGSAVGPAFILALAGLVYFTAGAIIYAIVTGRQKQG
ncbi:MAG: zinc-ribbon domain-containing protein [bacterium]